MDRDYTAPPKADPPKRKTPAAKPTSKAAKSVTRTNKAKAPTRATRKDTAATALTDKQQKFVDEYLVDLNATQAAIRAGYSAKTAAEMGYENLRKPQIVEAIAKARKDQQERTGITSDRVVREAWNLVTADARELTQLHIGCCRYCHGIEHRFQRTDRAYENEYDEWLNSNDPEKGEFDTAGGPGYHPNREPHPGCPECGGHGVPRAILMDTRNLSEKAASLFAGVKEGKFGIEIQMHDKAAAMEKLFRHLGLYEKDNEQKVDALATLLYSISSNSNSSFRPVADDPEQDKGED